MLHCILHILNLNLKLNIADIRFKYCTKYCRYLNLNIADIEFMKIGIMHDKLTSFYA